MSNSLLLKFDNLGPMVAVGEAVIPGKTDRQILKQYIWITFGVLPLSRLPGGFLDARFYSLCPFIMATISQFIHYNSQTKQNKGFAVMATWAGNHGDQVC